MPKNTTTLESCSGRALLACCLTILSGCQTWHTASAIPGLSANRGERQVLRQAKNDPFPSPSEVGIKATK